MQIIALKFNKATLGDEAYQKLKEKLINEITKAIGEGHFNRALSMEVTEENETDHIFLLETEDTTDPNKVRDKLADAVDHRCKIDITPSMADFAGTNPFTAIPTDGELPQFAAIRAFDGRERPKKVIHADPVWTGEEQDHDGIKGLFGEKVFILNLKNKGKTWMVITDTNDPSNIVSRIHDSSIGEHVRAEQAEINPHNKGGWKDVSKVAQAIPSQKHPSAAENIRITAQHLTV